MLQVDTSFMLHDVSSRQTPREEAMLLIESASSPDVTFHLCAWKREAPFYTPFNSQAGILFCLHLYLITITLKIFLTGGKNV